MDEGDVLHILIDGETGTLATIDMLTENADGSTTEESAPEILDLESTSGLNFSGFTLNWNILENATGYCLDISYDEDFAVMVSGYDNLDLGNVSTLEVTGFDADTYYCRLRAYNEYGTSTDSNTVTVVVSWFSHTYVRNAEMDNTLTSAGGTALAISNVTGRVITVPNLPDYVKFDEDGWVAMLIDEHNTSTVDPNDSGDYAYRVACTIDRTAKTLTVPVGEDLSHYHIGDNVMVFNAFLNYSFVGDQTGDPLITTSDAPAWRSTYSIGGCLWKHSDGTYYRFFTGGDYTQGFGYATSPDLVTWTMGNGDLPLVTPLSSGLTDCTDLFPSSSCIQLTATTYAVLISCHVSAPAPTGRMAVMYFNEDLTTITFSGYLSFGGYNVMEGSIHKIGDYYHILYRSGQVTPKDRYITACKSLNLEGPYVDYQNILKSDDYYTHDGVAYSNNVDASFIGEIGGKVFGLFGATARYSPSGNKGNREFVLLDFDEDLETWSISDKGVVISNPLYYYYVDMDYLWASDHVGSTPSLFIDGEDIYFHCSMKGAFYQSALIKLFS